MGSDDSADEDDDGDDGNDVGEFRDCRMFDNHRETVVERPRNTIYSPMSTDEEVERYVQTCGVRCRNTTISECTIHSKDLNDEQSEH